MKAIKLNIIITSIRSRKEGSLGFSAETPELSREEKVSFMDLQGISLNALFEPEEGSSEVLKVEREIGIKSQSQRLRAVIALVCKSIGKPEESERVYFNEMEQLINKYKDKLE